MPESDHRGGCLCGGVRFAVRGPMRDVVACHCGQCRRTSGHFAAFSNAATEAIVFDTAVTLRWYRSSPEAERGFCDVCGSSLFWRRVEGDTTSVAAGALDGATELSLVKHIFVADKGDYYALEGDAPRFEQD